MEILETVQYNTKFITGLEDPSYEEKMTQLGLFSLEKKRLKGNLITLCKHLKAG